MSASVIELEVRPPLRDGGIEVRLHVRAESNPSMRTVYAFDFTPDQALELAERLQQHAAMAPTPPADGSADQ